MALGQQAAAGIDHALSAEAGLAGPQQLGPVARLAEPQLLVGHELRRRGGVVELDDVDLVRPDARLLVRLRGGPHGGSRLVV